jgi:hypothetical protein
MTVMLRTSLALLLLAPCVAYAQAPAAPPQQPAAPAGQPQRPDQPRGPRPAPTNLKVLPKTMTGDEVIKLMRQYEGDLGVECEFCHAAAEPGKRRDNASDANPMKETARYMITMTADLNDKYLADMPTRRYADPITCGTCHRGEKHPSIFVPKPQPPRNGPGGPPPATMPAPAVNPAPTTPRPSGK